MCLHNEVEPEFPPTFYGYSVVKEVEENIDFYSPADFVWANNLQETKYLLGKEHTAEFRTTITTVGYGGFHGFTTFARLFEGYGVEWCRRYLHCVCYCKFRGAIAVGTFMAVGAVMNRSRLHTPAFRAKYRTLIKKINFDEYHEAYNHGECIKENTP